MDLVVANPGRGWRNVRIDVDAPLATSQDASSRLTVPTGHDCSGTAGQRASLDSMALLRVVAVIERWMASGGIPDARIAVKRLR
jgi:hypothetical protein